MSNTRPTNSLSPDVTDLLQKMPGRLVTYASLFFLFFTMVLLFIAWVVKYPDMVEGQVNIKTMTPPVRLVGKSSGELINIAVAENQAIRKGEVIAEVKSLVSPEALAVLRQIAADEGLNSLSLLSTSITFGEMQPTINQLREFTASYETLMNDPRYESEMQALDKRLRNNDQLVNASKAELAMRERMLETQKEKFGMYQELFDTKGISKLEYLNRKGEFDQQQIELSAMKKRLIQQQLGRDEIAQRIKDNQLKKQEDLKLIEQKIQSAVSTVKNFLSTFESNYQLIAPSNGVLSYLSDLHEGQFVTAGTPLFAIVPADERYSAAVLVPQSQKGFGKIEAGQQVIIELAQYAGSEYGMLYGTVEDISLLQSDGTYRVSVALPEVLKTNFDYELDLPPESQGMAKIITEDVRLIERLFYKIRKLSTQQ